MTQPALESSKQPVQAAPSAANNGMKIVTAETIAELLSRAAASPRKRANVNLHAELSDTTGRFLERWSVGDLRTPSPPSRSASGNS